MTRLWQCGLVVALVACVVASQDDAQEARHQQARPSPPADYNYDQQREQYESVHKRDPYAKTELGSHESVIEIPDLAIRQHSLLPPFLEDYLGSGLHFWEIGGDAVVSDRYVRVSSNDRTKPQAGYIWNERANDLPSWETRFALAVHNPLKPSTPGIGGIGFWCVQHPSKSLHGPAFGVERDFEGIGILFESASHADKNTIRVVYNHPNNDGVNHGAEEKPLHIGGCSIPFRYGSDLKHPVNVRVIYQSEDKKSLEVYVQQGPLAKEEHCITIKHIVLPTGYYFGFTAMSRSSFGTAPPDHTGVSFDNQDLMAFFVVPARGATYDHDLYAEDSDVEQAAQEHPEVKQGHKAKFDHKFEEREKGWWKDHGDVQPDPKRHKAGGFGMPDDHGKTIKVKPGEEVQRRSYAR